MAQLTSGVKITVDTSEIKNKFNKSVEELNSGLTKVQRSLLLTYNAEGQLTNALGQCVEGLGTNQIKLGQYVDELGRVRTYQGGFTDGLNKSQIAMGMYTDELGNVYSKTGELIGQTDKAAKAIEREAAAAAQRAAKELEALANSARNASQEIGKAAGAFKNVASAAQQLGDLMKTAGQVFGENNGLMKEAGEILGGVGKAAGTAFDTLNKVTAAADALRALPKNINALKNVPAYLTAIKTAAMGIHPAAIAAGVAVAAIAGAIYVMNKTHPVEELSGEFKELEEKAKAAGGAIKDASDALKYGAFAVDDNSIEGAAKRMEELGKEAERRKNEAPDALKFKWYERLSPATMNGNTMALKLWKYWGAKRDADNAANKFKNATAEYNNKIADVVKEAREAQKTTADKLEDQIRDIDSAIKIAKETGQTQEDIHALEELRAAKEAERVEEVRKAALAEKGLTDLITEAQKELDAAAPAFRDTEETARRLEEALAEGSISQEQYDAALKLLQKQTNDVAEAAARWKIDAPEFPSLPPGLSQDIDALDERLRSGSISLGEYAAETQKARAAFRSTQLEEAAQELARGFEEGRIAGEQYAALMKNINAEIAETLAEGLGIDAPEFPQAPAGMQGTLDALSDQLRTGTMSLAEYRDAVENARREFDTAQTAQTLEEVRAAFAAGKISADQYAYLIEQAAKKQAAQAEAEGDVVKALQLYRDAVEQGAMTQKDADEHIAAIQADAADKMRELYKGTTDAVEAMRAWEEAAAQGTVAAKDAAEAVQELRDAERARLAARTGVSFEVKEEPLSFGKSKEALSEALKKGLIEQEEYNAGIASLKEAARKAEPGLEALLQQANQAKPAGDPITAARAEYAETLRKLNEAETKGLYTAEESRKIRQQAEAKRDAAIEEAAEKERAEVDKMRAAVGIDKLLDSLKTPLDHFRDAMEQIEEATAAGAISANEAALLQAQAEDDYWSKMGECAQSVKDVQDRAAEMVG